MKGIIIGAGRGQRLMPLTEGTPKCFTEVGGRRLLDWALDAYAEAGVREVVFIGGYQIERVRAEYPGLTFCHNREWETNNILASLFYAEDHMSGGFICAYSDILYRPEILKRLCARDDPMTLAVDTDWRARYAGRSQHPEDDAEKVLAANGRITAIGRHIPSETAHGEYIGVARFTPDGAVRLRDHYHRLRREFAGRPFRGDAPFVRAYLIDLFQEMLARGETLAHLDTPGGYHEIDTTEDYALAQVAWAPQSATKETDQ
jgi:choline kinase